MAKKSLSTHFAVYIRAKPVKQNALNYLLYTQVRHLTVHWCLSTKTPSYAFNKKNYVTFWLFHVNVQNKISLLEQIFIKRFRKRLINNATYFKLLKYPVKCL